MRWQINDVKCTKCGHVFGYDSGCFFFEGYKTKEEAEENKTYPDDKVEFAEGIGWYIIHRGESEDE